MSQSHNLSDFSFTCRECGKVIWEPENQDKGKCDKCMTPDIGTNRV